MPNLPNIPFPTDFSVQGVRSEFDRLLDRVWHLGLSTAPLDGQDWAPSLDVWEEPDSYTLRAELPGMGPEDISVEILGNLLTIRGFKPAIQKPAEKARQLRSECRYGSFNRKMELPAPVDEGSVQASCKNGVLEVRIAKTASAQGRSVKVQGDAPKVP
jgi:HSP20 family protein